MPRPKTDRDGLLTRPTRELGDTVRQKAQDSGLTISDYIATVLANEVGRPDLAPRPRMDEELPLTG